MKLHNAYFALSTALSIATLASQLDGATYGPTPETTFAVAVSGPSRLMETCHGGPRCTYAGALFSGGGTQLSTVGQAYALISDGVFTSGYHAVIADGSTLLPADQCRTELCPMYAFLSDWEGRDSAPEPWNYCMVGATLRLENLWPFGDTRFDYNDAVVVPHQLPLSCEKGIGIVICPNPTVVEFKHITDRCDYTNTTCSRPKTGTAYGLCEGAPQCLSGERNFGPIDDKEVLSSVPSATATIAPALDPTSTATMLPTTATPTSTPTTGTTTMGTPTTGTPTAGTPVTTSASTSAPNCRVLALALSAVTTLQFLAECFRLCENN